LLGGDDLAHLVAQGLHGLTPPRHRHQGLRRAGVGVDRFGDDLGLVGGQRPRAQSIGNRGLAEQAPGGLHRPPRRAHRGPPGGGHPRGPVSMRLTGAVDLAEPGGDEHLARGGEPFDAHEPLGHPVQLLDRYDRRVARGDQGFELSADRCQPVHAAHHADALRHPKHAVCRCGSL